MPAPMPAPIMNFAIVATELKRFPTAFSPPLLMSAPICAKMVPAIKVAKSPSAIPLKASINHLLAQLLTFSLNSPFSIIFSANNMDKFYFKKNTLSTKYKKKTPEASQGNKKSRTLRTTVMTVDQRIRN